MVPPRRSDTPDQDYYAQPEAPDLLGRWIQHKAAVGESRVRWPALLLAQRLGLADRRCLELAGHIAQTRDRLLNPAPGSTLEHRLALEERLFLLDDQLRRERGALLDAIAPLVEAARDAVVERARASALAELLRDPGGEGPAR